MNDEHITAEHIELAIAEFAIKLIESQVSDCELNINISEDEWFEMYI